MNCINGQKHTIDLGYCEALLKSSIESMINPDALKWKISCSVEPSCNRIVTHAIIGETSTLLMCNWHKKLTLDSCDNPPKVFEYTPIEGEQVQTIEGFATEVQLSENKDIAHRLFSLIIAEKEKDI
jgi:hypothetical protein